MMIPRPRRLASWGGALALGLSAATSFAQDASPPGPPVTDPATNQSKAPVATTQPKAKTGTTADDLPGVPATRRDPAPPGTRAVPVDSAKGAPGPGTPAAGQGTRKSAARGQVFTAEGVVTRIDRAGKNVSGELERFAFDPSQSWASYVDRGAQGVLEKDADRPKTTEDEKSANTKQHEDSSAKPAVMEMAITKRSYVYTFARDAEGVDQYASATSSSPDLVNSRTGVTNRQPAPPPTGPVATNFTNLKEGSFVSVRYRKAGDVNEVLNLTLIELPLNPGGDVYGAGSSSVTGNRAPGGASTTPAGTAPGGRISPTVPAGTRVPSVPLEPTGPGSPR